MQRVSQGTKAFLSASATGILLFQVDETLVDTSNNTYRNNDINLFNGSNL